MGKIVKYTQTAVYNTQKNLRKINAIIRRSQIRRIKAILMLMVILAQTCSTILAIENTNLNYGTIDIKHFIDSKSYIRYNGILQRNTEYYYIKDNEQYTAYCINLGLNGAELHPQGHYEVNASAKISDEILNKIVLNCYPYKSINELKVNTVDEARFASQFAIWCYTSNLNLDLIEAASPEYENVVTCIKQIYNNGLNSNENHEIKFDKKVGEQKLEQIDTVQYYTKEIELVSSNIKNVKLNIIDSNVKIIKNDSGYKICVPCDIVDKVEEYNLSINYDIEAKENVALIGTSSIVNYQDVVITLKEFFTCNYKDNINFKSLNSKVIVNKKDKETSQNLQGAVYEVSYEDGKLIGRYETDKNGEFIVNLKNDKKCHINLKEIEAPKGYEIDNKVYNVELEKNDSKTLQLYNEKSKGYIQIIKKSKEYNQITMYEENTPLSDVSFYVYNVQGELVDDITTDEYGKATTKALELGKYYIKEYRTKNGYKTLDEIIEVEIAKNDDYIRVNVLNENVDIPRVLPKTGK